MKTLYCVCVCLLQLVACAPARDFVFPDEGRRQKKLEPIITPPVLPVLEHLERDPSTLLPNEAGFRHANPSGTSGRVKPRFGGGFSVAPSDGGLTASFSSSAGGAGGGGGGHAASQSFSVGFNQQGFTGSQSASQSASFGSGHSFSGSQSSSQAASFSGGSASAAASQAAAFAGSGQSGSQSSAFGFNSLNGFQPNPTEYDFGEGVFDVRHGRTRDFPLPGRGRDLPLPGRTRDFPDPGRGRDFPVPGRTRDFPFPGAFGKDFNGVAAFVSSNQKPSRKTRDDILTIFLGDRK